jgi:hypothetical protein
VSPWIVPCCIGIGAILPKYPLENIVVEKEYMLPPNCTASNGYPRSYIIASSLVWSRDPKAFLKSIYEGICHDL